MDNSNQLNFKPMNEAIKLAIEKGKYEISPTAKSHFSSIDALDFYVVQDPLFWQALGKALGWDDGELVDPTYTQAAQSNPSLWMWQHQAHKYFDLILTGGDTKKFWKKLLGSNQYGAATA